MDQKQSSSDRREGTVDDPPCVKNKNEFVARCVPNKDLTPGEKQVKKALKARLKLESRKRKYQIRYEHALRRKDLAAADQALRDLQTVLQQQNPKDTHANPANSMDDPSAVVNESRRLIESIYHEIQRKIKPRHFQESKRWSSESTAAKKEFQTHQARSLLRNMTKGTQELAMFDNEEALKGYVRQKFIERAILIATSASKLIPPSDSVDEKGTTRDRLWNRLRSVQSVVSIGCGPGCDGVGMAAWLAALSGAKSLGEQNSRLKRLVLLDWAMPKWKSLVEPVKNIILGLNLVQDVQLNVCDVLGNTEYASSNHAAFEKCAEADLIMTSYLLSETRGRWFEFYDRIMDACSTKGPTQGHCEDSKTTLTKLSNKGTLFLFTDPTAWQLHEWLNRNRNRLDCWCWLDSSMDNEDLQILEGRVGPAVLLAMSKPNTLFSTSKSGNIEVNLI